MWGAQTRSALESGAETACFQAKPSLRTPQVDDNDAFRTRVAVLLWEWANVVEQAADGETGLRLAQELRPDLIVMDISMPRMDGVSAARAILARQPKTRIVFISGTETAAKLAEASTYGVVIEKHIADLREQLLAVAG